VHNINGSFFEVMLWFRRFSARLSLQRTAFDSWPGNIRSVLNKVTLGQVSVRVIPFPCSIISPMTHIHLRIITTLIRRTRGTNLGNFKQNNVLPCMTEH
jgi:hypothetical protein